MFLMLGPYGPPLTTNGRTEDLDHLSVKTEIKNKTKQTKQKTLS